MAWGDGCRPVGWGWQQSAPLAKNQGREGEREREIEGLGLGGVLEETKEIWIASAM